LLRRLELPSGLPGRFNMAEGWMRVRRCARTPFIILLKAAVQAPDKEWPPFGGRSQMVAWAMRAWRIACAAVC
jgi:hypothetical protein